MSKALPRIVAINPGSRYLGMAAFEGPELRDWRVKGIGGKGANAKLTEAESIVAKYMQQHDPHALAIKQLHPRRKSPGLDRLIARVKRIGKRRGLKIAQYSIRELEAALSPEEKINKRELAEIVASLYPALCHELHKERQNKNPYHLRMFEAVALGVVCCRQLEK